MRREILALLLLACGWPSVPASAGDAAALLTQGKLDVDIGKPEAAAEAFQAVAADTTAPAPLRAEALVRLGLVRRDLGDARGAAETFERAWTAYGREKNALRLLVQAVSGVLPGEERWNEIWQQVVVSVDRADPERPIARVEWPGVPIERRTYAGRPTATLDLREASLFDLLRMFADVTRLNIVVHPGPGGKVTVNVRDMPWDQVLDRALATVGLAANRVGNVVEIGPPTRLGTGSRFDGRPIDVDFEGVDLLECLRRIAANGGRMVSGPPQPSGKTTLKLTQVPWDQAFDLVVRLHGLAWKREGATIRVDLRANLQ